MTLKYLIQKEFLQIRRNAFLPRLNHVRDAVGDADGSEEHRGGCS